MHELSIALAIVEFAEDEFLRLGGAHVTAVHVRMGPFAGVVKQALLSSYEIACEDSALAGSQLLIEEVPGVVVCPRCGERPAQSSEWYCCSECGGPVSGIVKGKELEIVALEVEE